MSASDILQSVHARRRHLSAAEIRVQIEIAQRYFADELAAVERLHQQAVENECVLLRAWERFEVRAGVAAYDGAPVLTKDVVYLATMPEPSYGIRSFDVGVGIREPGTRQVELLVIYRVSYQRSLQTGRATGDRLTLRVTHGEPAPEQVERWLTEEWLHRVNMLGMSEDPRLGMSR